MSDRHAFYSYPGLVHVHQQMQAAVDSGVFPGGVLLVSRNGQRLFLRAYGAANLYSGDPATVDTVYDLASLTKPLATALALMKLIEKGCLTLDCRLDRLLEEARHSSIGHIQIQELLYHVSGLPSYRPYYRCLAKIPAGSRKKVLNRLLLKVTPVYPAGSQTLYSDIGFMLLRWIVETVSGAGLNQLVARELYAPLGLRRLFFNPLDRRPVNAAYAATEDCPWRGEVLSGKVHDDNTYVVGGVDGQAGLFGTVHDVHVLLRELLFNYHGLAENGLFKPELVRRFFSRFEGRGRALGFDAPSPSNSSAGRHFSFHSVGHLGFTGTSFWMDLDKKIIIILLTNRVHPTRSNQRIKRFRPVLHDLIMETVCGSHLK